MFQVQAFENSAEVVSPDTCGLRICDIDRAFCDRVVKKLKGLIRKYRQHCRRDISLRRHKKKEPPR
ncbi:hypothetical protein CXQ81_25580 [Pseudomonas sp. 09C 129]|nr:hypothetical protein CXQ81_25580 [Pseudomonas sp. 09C 129]AUG42707.1 hypothetical protein CXP47_23435 [Pseudomonas chlororaphis]KAB0535229.1 hypothetical protein F7R16_03985 [Pseudomonas chlororaphis subsp. aureofaciens]POA67277.1 hypothetical protein C1888_21070 [Pseudomonas sp. GW531-T4]PWY37079.1 hypothetical protein DK261_32015 [Pseudomonas sp. RW409]QFS56697.1 hypothetical protein FD951_19910 [Pseudomonas chlororaphis subsp. aurantiaca]TSD28548.1 hypothetical protein FCE86_002885 [Pse